MSGVVHVRSLNAVRNCGMDNAHATQMLKTALSLRSSLLVVISRVDDLCDLIEKAAPTAYDATPIVTGTAGPQLRVDRATYTVSWGSKRCVLGHTMAFHIIERLARRPNEYINMDRLLEELWTGSRTYSTVRSTVCRLKIKLRDSGMTDLATQIDGSMRGHYGLMLQGTP